MSLTRLCRSFTYSTVKPADSHPYLHVTIGRNLHVNMPRFSVHDPSLCGRLKAARKNDRETHGDQEAQGSDASHQHR